jgi:hypothetical protein
MAITAEGGQPPPKALRGYHDLLPDIQKDDRSGDEHDGVS